MFFVAVEQEPGDLLEELEADRAEQRPATTGTGSACAARPAAGTARRTAACWRRARRRARAGRAARRAGSPRFEPVEDVLGEPGDQAGDRDRDEQHDADDDQAEQVAQLSAHEARLLAVRQLEDVDEGVAHRGEPAESGVEETGQAEQPAVAAAVWKSWIDTPCLLARPSRAGRG